MKFWQNGIVRFVRLYSNIGTVEQCRQWLLSLRPDQIPRQCFDVSFARSSGPGGQNVNKVSTKACIKLSKEQWDQLEWIPDPVKEKLESSATFTYLTKSGNLVIQSEKTRSRQENLDDCFRKLCTGIKNSVHFESEPTVEGIAKWEKISTRTNVQRLNHKKRQSQKKQNRKRAIDD